MSVLVGRRREKAGARAQYRALLGGAPGPAGSWRGEPSGDFPSLAQIWTALEALRDAEGPPALPEGASMTRVLLGYAPTALLDGCWLAGLVRVRGADSALGAACLDAFFFEAGEGDAAGHHGNLYRALLAAQGLATPEPGDPGLAEDPRLGDEDFRLALPGLRLAAQEGDALLPEALGFHAAATVLGPPAPVVHAAAAAGQSGYLARHRPGAAPARRASELARRCLEAYAARGQADWPRVWGGASVLLRHRRAWGAALGPPAEPPPRAAMLRLLEAKAPHAFGHHAAVRLAGRPLDAWLDPARLDGDALLSALAGSPWVEPGWPEQSALLARMVRFGGPMFGVFTDDELAVIGAWIRSLGEAPRPPAPDPAPIAREAPGEPHPPPRAPRRGRALGLPQLYHALLCRGHDPDVAAEARAHLAATLERAGRSVSPRRLAARGLWPGSKEGLAGWSEARLAEQVRPGPADGPGGIERELTRDEVLWLLGQLAPAALVDGAWLEGVAAPGRSHTPVAALLLRIYRDELGAGVPAQHHGNVLRRALAAQGVMLPPCDSEALSRSAALLPEAFSTPVVWLAMAQKGQELLPELLGLNLAIEMAGLGSTYRRAIALLARHGVDRYFFELHNSIDNAASGHTAWSLQAIGLHMDEVGARGGAAALGEAWLRLWRGHAAYEVASAPLVRAIGLRLGPRLGWRWLRRRLGPARAVGG